MSVFKDLFTSDVGILSAATIGVVIVMAVYFMRFFARHIREEEAQGERR